VSQGSYATIPGGFQNQAAGDHSFAAGYRSTVLTAHEGTFLYADASDFEFPSEAPNEFAARATGGIRLVTALDEQGQPLAGVEVAAGSGSWSSLSTREAKANITPVDVHEVLKALADLPVSTWNYRGQDASVRHLGPIAQDFHSSFGLGGDDQRISMVDADGVALAAAQGLFQLAKEQEGLLATQQRQIAALEARIAALEQISGSGEHQAGPPVLLVPVLLLILSVALLAGFILPQLGGQRSRL
jgi:hypothetical protein